MLDDSQQKFVVEIQKYINIEAVNKVIQDLQREIIVNKTLNYNSTGTKLALELQSAVKDALTRTSSIIDSILFVNME